MFTHAVDTDTSLWASYGVNTQPAFTFINDDGTEETHIGRLGQESLETRVEALLAG